MPSVSRPAILTWAYSQHSCCRIRIFEKVFDNREKRCNFVYRHEWVDFLVWCHIFAHFLEFIQEIMSFFLTSVFWNHYLRNLNNEYYRPVSIIEDLAKQTLFPHRSHSDSDVHPILYSFFCPDGSPDKCHGKRNIIGRSFRNGKDDAVRRIDNTRSGRNKKT